jgi:nicotinamidase-related amidase
VRPTVESGGPIIVTRSAVVIGDLQVGITRRHPFAADLVSRAAALAAAARQRGDLVVFVHIQLRANGADVSARNAGIQAIFAMGDDYHDGATGVQLDPGLGFEPGDVIVTKHRASAFAGTDLDLILRSRGIDSIAIAGVATSAMVAATAYDAADRDYRVRVVSDVCADPVPDVHEFFVSTVFPGRGMQVIVSSDIGPDQS